MYLTMQRDRFGIMPGLSSILCCIFMVGCAIIFNPSYAVKVPSKLGMCEAVAGLSVDEIERCTNISSLSSLSKVEGWNYDQAQAILEKLFNSGYQIPDGESLAALGSLVVGLSSSSLQAVPPEAVLEAVKTPGFAKHLEKGPSELKSAVVQKLAAVVDGLNDLVKNVPDGLIPFIPKSLLVPTDTVNIQDLNHKPWTPEQAAIFFDEVVKNISDFNSLSPSILHGVTCTALAMLTDDRIQQLAKALKEKNVQLSKEQLNCLAERMLLTGIPNNLEDYPKDLILFLSLSDYAKIGNCKEYIAHIRKANLDILEKDSLKRKQLLEDSLTCLKIPGLQISKENGGILGHLVCDLGGDYIAASGENLLEQLSRCQSFTPDQTKAIQEIFRNGKTSFGPPSTWSTSTLDKLGQLISVLDPSTLRNIPKGILMPWLQHFFSHSSLSREQQVQIVKNLKFSRHKRSTDCPPDLAITEEMLKDGSMPIFYTAEDLHACLTEEILLNNLSVFTDYPFTNEQLEMVKQSLDETFPKGYPPSVIRNLGVLIKYMKPEEIKKWDISSPSELAALLKSEPDDDLATLIIDRYIDLGNKLDSQSLDALGPYICQLNQKQLDMIGEKDIKMATSLDPSKCSQAVKDNLYPKAKRAFSDRHYQYTVYYNLIKPFLGGAPGDDLRALSKNNINMDIDTFMGLKTSSLKELTPDQVKALMGINVKSLKEYQNVSPVKEWIQNQKQSDLDKMGLGFKGGLPEGYIVLKMP